MDTINAGVRSISVRRVLVPKVKYTLEQKTTILRAYRERISLRGLQRVFGVWRRTVLRWLKAWVENLPSLHETLLYS
jgi:insertion element IS1 protein InsB